VSGHLTLDQPISAWVLDVQFVPESTPLDELLTRMQNSGQHMAVVVDEFGSTAGLVTLQDLISQIIGETPENGSDEAQGICWLDANTCIVQAQLDVEEINDRLELDLPITDEYRSLGGLLFYQWQRIPIVGETLQYGDCELTLISADGPQLREVRIHRLDPTAVDGALVHPDAVHGANHPQKTFQSTTPPTA
jgi:CBS domain containing-hemolysin-like protein